MDFFYCANILQPIYAWVAGEDYVTPARNAIVYSDPVATDFIVDSIGGVSSMLDCIAYKAGVRLEVADSWDKVYVNELSLRVLYSVLGFARDDWSKTIKSFMTDVPVEQRFNIPTGVPLKAGWGFDEVSCSLLTHLVVLIRDKPKVNISSVAVSESEAEIWKDNFHKNGPSSVINMHVEVSEFLFTNFRRSIGEAIFL